MDLYDDNKIFFLYFELAMSMQYAFVVPYLKCVPWTQPRFRAKMLLAIFLAIASG